MEWGKQKFKKLNVGVLLLSLCVRVFHGKGEQRGRERERKRQRDEGDRENEGDAADTCVAWNEDNSETAWLFFLLSVSPTLLLCDTWLVAVGWNRNDTFANDN